ncbi:MAG: phosphatidylinositol-specific phospholipase C/glycerophosphodiester phosphodiesterase family protein, partial [Polymorphobacter sp.]
QFGIEMDVRSHGDRLILHHDPFVDGEDLVAWLGHYRHGTLILNVKEEGLEHRLLALMAAHGIENFFFLDQSFPFLMRTARTGERRCAVRVSEYESIATALTLAGQVDWVWVDCFTRLPLDSAGAATLTSAGFKLCLVSPELQGRPAEAGIAAMRAQVAGFDIAAVCTKRPDLWA